MNKNIYQTNEFQVKRSLNVFKNGMATLQTIGVVDGFLSEYQKDPADQENWEPWVSNTAQ